MKDDILWKDEKRKLQCDLLDKDSEGEEENKEDFYAGKETFFQFYFEDEHRHFCLGLDPDYIEYLKSKKQKALDAERVMTEEQKQSKISF